MCFTPLYSTCCDFSLFHAYLAQVEYFTRLAPPAYTHPAHAPERHAAPVRGHRGHAAARYRRATWAGVSVAQFAQQSTSGARGSRSKVRASSPHKSQASRARAGAGGVSWELGGVGVGAGGVVRGGMGAAPI